MPYKEQKITVAVLLIWKNVCHCCEVFNCFTQIFLSASPSKLTAGKHLGQTSRQIVRIPDLDLVYAFKHSILCILNISLSDDELPRLREKTFRAGNGVDWLSGIPWFPEPGYSRLWWEWTQDPFPAKTLGGTGYSEFRNLIYSTPWYRVVVDEHLVFGSCQYISEPNSSCSHWCLKPQMPPFL